MLLTNLRLASFRNHLKKEFEFSGKTTLVVGPNTSGKTNILESIYLLASGKSLRANLEQEMISWGEEVARVKGRVAREKEKTDLEVVLTRGEIGGEKVARKKFLVNGVAKRMMDFAGNLKAVYFGPQDLDLITDSPSLRRKYLDLVLSQVDHEYARSLLSYEKAVRQRNKLLERIRDEGVSPSQLLFWNQLLIKEGEIVTQRREEFIQFCNEYKIEALPAFQLIYDKSIISPARLEEYAREEIAAGITLVGPHRDNFEFDFKERNLSSFGSRGEQRLAVLWLKLCELEFINQKANERPILLLDDIFSELDQEHRNLVLETISAQQTIITTADIEMIEKEYLEKMETIKLGV